LVSESHPQITYIKTFGFPTRYRGGGFDNVRYQGFKPRALCCDKESNLFVYDHASAIIQIIDSSAKLVGLLITNDDDLTGDPNCLSFDSDGKLWIGDAFSGRVRVYKVEKTYNDLISSPISGESDNELNTGIPSVLVGADGNNLSFGQNVAGMMQNHNNPLSMQHGVRTPHDSMLMSRNMIPPTVRSLEATERDLLNLRESMRMTQADRKRCGVALPGCDDILNDLLQHATDNLSRLKFLTGLSPENTQITNVDNSTHENLETQLSQFRHDTMMSSENTPESFLSSAGYPSNNPPSVGGNFIYNATTHTESPVNRTPHLFSRSDEINLCHTESTPYLSNNMRSPGVITVSVPTGIDGTLLSREEFQSMTGPAHYVEERQGIGSLLRGPSGTFLNLPAHIVNDPQLKQLVLGQISSQTGLSEDQLANMITTPQ